MFLVPNFFFSSPISSHPGLFSPRPISVSISPHILFRVRLYASLLPGLQLQEACLAETWSPETNGWWPPNRWIDQRFAARTWLGSAEWGGGVDVFICDL